MSLSIHMVRKPKCEYCIYKKRLFLFLAQTKFYNRNKRRRLIVKHYIMLLFISTMVPGMLQACILRQVINNSQKCEILIRSVILPGLEKSAHPNVVTPRKGEEPHIINTHNKLGVGEYMRILVTEKSPLGATCKKYRIYVDDEKKRLVLQKKDGCSIGLLEYETLVVIPMPGDPEHCYVDLYLIDDVNSLYVNIVDDPEADTESIENIVAEQNKQDWSHDYLPEELTGA